ncbi:hypothetical protein KAU33_02540 [Candidatus Dependentiae bacterium]|nr:hypothetical protein [Candidatus Dependentiae bacterium]
MIETRSKEISNKFLVTFSAEPLNEVSVRSGEEELGSMSFLNRKITLEVYQNITSTKDARNFVSIVNDNNAQNINNSRKRRLMRIMDVRA